MVLLLWKFIDIVAMYVKGGRRGFNPNLGGEEGMAGID